MTEENISNTGAVEGDADTQFALQRIYLKDLSFETPMGVDAFQRELKPQIGQELSTNITQLDETHFEVVLVLTITVKDGEDVVYLVEVHQAGIFKVKGLEKAQMAQVLNVFCPSTIYPYAREVVDNVVIKGSFPALMLPPVNFDALFAQALAERQAKKDQSDSSDSEVTH